MQDQIGAEYININLQPQDKPDLMVKLSNYNAHKLKWTCTAKTGS